MESDIGLIEETAKGLAWRLHGGQLDWTGRPYIEHLARVATSPRLLTEEDRAAAWLHDSIENTEATVGTLIYYKMPRAVVMTVDILTRRKKEPYSRYLHRVGTFPWTRAIKLADIDDHLADTTHIPLSLERRYVAARAYLEGL